MRICRSVLTKGSISTHISERSTELQQNYNKITTKLFCKWSRTTTCYAALHATGLWDRKTAEQLGQALLFALTDNAAVQRGSRAGSAGRQVAGRGAHRSHCAGGWGVYEVTLATIIATARLQTAARQGTPPAQAAWRR